MMTLRLDCALAAKQKIKVRSPNVQKRSGDFMNTFLSISSGHSSRGESVRNDHAANSLQVPNYTFPSTTNFSERLIHYGLRQVMRPGGGVIGQPEARIDLRNDDLAVRGAQLVYL